jgi:hypothetical protein
MRQDGDFALHFFLRLHIDDFHQGQGFIFHPFG